MAKLNPYLKSLPGSNPPKKEKVQKVKFSAPPVAPAATAEHEALRAEILRLGGDEEDLRIIQDVDSDSEVEGEPIAVPPTNLKKTQTAVDVCTALCSHRTQLIPRN